MNCLNNLLVKVEVKFKAKTKISGSEISRSFILFGMGVYCLKPAGYFDFLELAVLNRIFL